MRVHLGRLGVAVACATAALALFGIAVGTVGSANRPGNGIDQARSPQARSDWNPPLQRGELTLVSERMSPISARRMISDPGLNTPLTLAADGRKITVTGHVGCIKGDEFKIQTSVTQRTTGALARGETSGTCTGKEEQFSAATWAYDEELFAAGPAQACGLLVIRTKGKAADAFQWCRKEDVTLTLANASY